LPPPQHPELELPEHLPPPQPGNTRAVLLGQPQAAPGAVMRASTSQGPRPAGRAIRRKVAALVRNRSSPGGRQATDPKQGEGVETGFGKEVAMWTAGGSTDESSWGACLRRAGTSCLAESGRPVVRPPRHPDTGHPARSFWPP
jgi:hypothetical protein